MDCGTQSTFGSITNPSAFHNKSTKVHQRAGKFFLNLPGIILANGLHLLTLQNHYILQQKEYGRMICLTEYYPHKDT